MILTDYVIHKGMVEEKDRNIYEYGFAMALEVGLFAVFSIFAALCLNMPIEGLIFFIIFAPLRSYAGGLHLEKFRSCFILSCLTYLAVLLAVKYVQVPVAISFTVLMIIEVAVYYLYPVEHANREVDEDENKYFKTKLLKFLSFDFITGIICLVLKSETFLFEMALIIFIVMMTMVMGKCKNIRNGMYSKNTKPFYLLLRVPREK